MSFERFDTWLTLYKQAWETRDPEAIATIFTRDATYQVTPFREAHVGHDGIKAYWIQATGEQRDVQFRSQMLATNGDTGICHWNVRFEIVPAGTKIEIDGIFVFDLDHDGRCRQFREWWHDREI